MGKKDGEKLGSAPGLSAQLETSHGAHRQIDGTRGHEGEGAGILHDGGGLYLRVAAAGSRSWVFRFQLAGKRRDMGLGSYPEISLAEARSRATEHRK